MNEAETAATEAATDADAEAIEALVETISEHLEGHPPARQGAVLADLLAIFLAGHYVAGDREATHNIRENILDDVVTFVRALIPINAEHILGDREP